MAREQLRAEQTPRARRFSRRRCPLNRRPYKRPHHPFSTIPLHSEPALLCCLPDGAALAPAHAAIHKMCASPARLPAQVSNRCCDQQAVRRADSDGDGPPAAGRTTRQKRKKLSLHVPVLRAPFHLAASFGRAPSAAGQEPVFNPANRTLPNRATTGRGAAVGGCSACRTASCKLPREACQEGEGAARGGHQTGAVIGSGK